MIEDRCLIHLLLLIDRVFSWSAIHKKEETTDDGEDLEEIVFGEVLVGVVLMELECGC